jgi:uncharacterized protein
MVTYDRAAITLKDNGMDVLAPDALVKNKLVCQHDKAQQQLIHNVVNRQHTLVLAPLRYGEMAMINASLQQINYPVGKLNFLLCANLTLVCEAIADAIGGLLGVLLPRNKQKQLSLLTAFKLWRAEVVGSVAAPYVKLYLPTQPEQQQHSLVKLLASLDEFAQALNKSAVVWMHELQQLDQIRAITPAVWGDLRSVITRSQQICYVFSGSQRYRLSQIFTVADKPLHRLCDLVVLLRNTPAVCQAQIQQQAKQRWGEELALSVVEQIMTLSECHPFYLNLICQQLWADDLFPTQAKVCSLWQQYVSNNQSTWADMLASLSNNQKSALRSLAWQPTNQPYAREYLLMTQLTIASQKQAIDALLEKDYIYKDPLGIFRLRDPALRTYSCMITSPHVHSVR